MIVSVEFYIDNHHLKFPKIDSLVFRCGRQIKGKKRATLRLSATVKFYLAILTEVKILLIEKINQSVGIDRNLDNLIMLSNGTIVLTVYFDKHLADKKYPKWLKKLAHRRARALKIVWDQHNEILVLRKIERL